MEHNYNVMIQLFKDRLKKREYPASLIDKVIHRISYKERFLAMDEKPPAPYIANKVSPTTPIRVLYRIYTQEGETF